MTGGYSFLGGSGAVPTKPNAAPSAEVRLCWLLEEHRTESASAAKTREVRSTEG